MTVLMLEPFPGKCCAAGCGPQQKTAAAHIRCRPDQIANALEAKHRVVNKKWYRVNSMCRIGCTSRDERRHRPGFGNTFFEQLAIGRFLVIDQRVTIDRLIQLAYMRVDAALAKQRF